MIVFESQTSFGRVPSSLVAVLLVTPLASAAPTPQSGQAASPPADAAGAPAPLVGGIVASDDVADLEALATYPYLGSTSLGHALEIPAGDALRGYAWDGGNRIPAEAEAGRLWVPYGELGSGPLTTLYCSYNETERPEQPGFVVEASGVSLADGGRTRGALRLEGPGSFVRYQGESAGMVGAPLALELWWRPEDGPPTRAATIARAPGFFRLWVDGQGRVLVDFDGDEPARARPQGTLRAGEWNRIALVVDPELGRARVALNDSVRALRLSPAQLHGSSRDLFLGKDTEPEGITGLVDELRIQRIALDSAELVDRYLLGASPGEHVLRADLASGPREVRVWAGIHAEPELRGRAALARGELAFFDPRDEGLVWTPAWWSRDLAVDGPVARTTQPVIYVGDSQAFLFSGETKDSYLPGMINTPDTWIYHIDEMRWEQVAGAGPPGRCHQSAAYSPDHDVVLLVGGWINSNDAEHRLLGDTWLFHVGERRWESRTPSGWQIGTVSDSGVLYNPRDRRFYLFQWNSVLAYDPEADSWTRLRPYRAVDAKGEPVADYKVPGSPICEYDPDRNQALIFGGVHFHKDRDNDYLDHTTVYDFETHTFTLLAPEQAPSRRTRGALAYDTKRERFVLFGGVQDQYSERRRDLWTFDMDAGRWQEVEDATPPSRRGGYYKMAYDPELDVFALLCGRASPNRFLNEAWRLHVDDRALARATYVFDRAGFPDRDQLVVDCDAADPERVRIELASSPDALAWSSGVTFDPGARYLRVSIACAAGEQPATIRALRFTSEPPPTGAAATTIHLSAVQ